MLGHCLILQRICIKHIYHYVLCLLSIYQAVLCLTGYVLSIIYLFIVAFNSAKIDLGNSITLNGIKFLHYLCLFVCIFYILHATFIISWLVLDSTLVNIIDFILWNIKDFILTESNFLLLLTWLGTGTSSSLCVSCMHLGYWGAGLAHIHPLEFWHTTLK